jgi:hypothetical protein
MERHKKGNAFPDLNVPGDPRLLSSIQRRTPGVAGGGINHYFGGTVITPPKSQKSKSSDPLGSLVPTRTRPAFIEAPASEGANKARVWFTFGTVNSKIATNLTDHFDFSFAKKFFAKVKFTTTGAFAVESWEIVMEAENFEMPAQDGPRPEYGYYLIGIAFEVGDSIVVIDNGKGSLNVWPQISNSLSGDTADSVIVWSRDG